MRKTYSDFGWVRRNRGNGEVDYLFVIDKPKNIEEKIDPRIKNPGGNNLGKNVESFLPKKIREETGISVVFTGKERDFIGRRKPLIEIEYNSHSFRIWEMQVSNFNLRKIPVFGMNILDVRYLNINEIIKARREGKFLDNHSLVVDREIISRFLKQ